jgi:hypothetical protein
LERHATQVALYCTYTIMRHTVIVCSAKGKTHFQKIG